MVKVYDHDNVIGEDLVEPRFPSYDRDWLACKDFSRKRKRHGVIKDSAKIFFDEEVEEAEVVPEPVADVAESSKPTDNTSMSIEQFEERKIALKGMFNDYLQPLLDQIESQTQLLQEKDRHIRKIEMQLKLLPDLEKHARDIDEQAKMAQFEKQALEKQLDLLKLDQITAEKVTKLSNSIIKRVEAKAEKLQEELDTAKEVNRGYSKLESEIELLKRPWWQKFFGM